MNLLHMDRLAQCPALGDFTDVCGCAIFAQLHKLSSTCTCAPGPSALLLLPLKLLLGCLVHRWARLFLLPYIDQSVSCNSIRCTGLQQVRQPLACLLWTCCATYAVCILFHLFLNLTLLGPNDCTHICYSLAAVT